MPEDYESESDSFRSPFWKDYARLIHSPSFRRLSGKTQLFPHNETDFFRNRLTHSIEVAQIAKSIARKLNHEYGLVLNEDLVEFAGLAHDIGHPPFGHQGEEALDECMRNYGGFEGNAQTLRILARLEKKKVYDFHRSGIDEKGHDQRVGLNLTLRTLASILKYDHVIPVNKVHRHFYAIMRGTNIKPVKGYYKSESEIVKKIKEHVVGNNYKGQFKTIECSIMDLADDIAYSTYDLEDAFKAGFLSPFHMLYPEDELIKAVVTTVNRRNNLSLHQDEVSEILRNTYDLFAVSQEDIDELNLSNPAILKDFIYFKAGGAYKLSREWGGHGSARSQYSSQLIDEFVMGIEFQRKDPLTMSKVSFRHEVLKKVEVLKTFTYESQILSNKLKIAELRGKDIIRKIFVTLDSAEGYFLLPDDFKEIHSRAHGTSRKKRAICDFIAGMTNDYAISFYGRLTSQYPETIFKPL